MDLVCVLRIWMLSRSGYWILVRVLRMLDDRF
jgi:hypothetical protein